MQQPPTLFDVVLAGGTVCVNLLPCMWLYACAVAVLGMNAVKALRTLRARHGMRTHSTTPAAAGYTYR